MESIKDTLIKFLRLDNLIDNISGYAEARLDLLKIEIREEVAKTLSRAVVIMAVIVTALIFLLFFSIGLANLLNEYFTHSYVGYWIVAGIYGIPCIAFLLFKKKISTYFEQKMLELIKQKDK
jgi:uncharacterized membrane protein